VKGFSIALAGSAMLMAVPAAASDKFWKTYADIGAIGIPVAAGGYSLYEGDRNGLLMLGETGLLTAASTEGLKYAVDERRPNGGKHSFPSGHTSISFAGAGYLHARYGWAVGLPFELLAATVGFARVKSHNHFWYDVVAGAAIGEGSAFLFTRRLNEKTRLSAYGDTGGGGVQLALRF
jgi:membrane-associated phospholipid phosphatase